MANRKYREGGVNNKGTRWSILFALCATGGYAHVNCDREGRDEKRARGIPSITTTTTTTTLVVTTVMVVVWAMVVVGKQGG